MAKERAADRSMTRKEVERLKAPLELDLTAYYKALEEEVVTTVATGTREGRTPAQIIGDVENLFAEDDE